MNTNPRWCFGIKVKPVFTQPMLNIQDKDIPSYEAMLEGTIQVNTPEHSRYVLSAALEQHCCRGR